MSIDNVEIRNILSNIYVDTLDAVNKNIGDLEIEEEK